MKFNILHKLTLLLSILLTANLTAVGPNQEARENMYVKGRDLYTAANEKVVFRGVNEMIVWSDDPTGNIIYPEIARSGANVVRIVWDTKADLALLDKSIANCVANEMIPLVELHDATGDIEKVEASVDHWLKPEMLAIIERYKKWFILNIANEAGVHGTPRKRYMEVYLDAIKRIRSQEITVPLIIDASDWGKDETLILDTWRELLAADPLSNTLFSVHTYWVKNQQERLDHLIKTVVADEIPFLFGEGPQQYGYDCESEFPWRNLLAQCQENDIGWIAWSWGYQDNGDCHPGKFDMTTDGIFGNWENDWGRGLVLEDPNSIHNTSKRPASIRKTLD